MFEPKDDAIDLLKRDHREVESLFAEFAKAADDSQRIELAQRICSELSIHARVEEELFYPAARDALGHDEASLVYEANVEHAGLKQLIGEIDGSSVDNEMFAARMQVLKEYVQHHVREEEMRLMPSLRRTVINLDALGDSIAQRKQDLLEQAQSARTAPSGKRIHVPGIEQETATRTSRRSVAPKRTTRKTATRKDADAPRGRARPAKRRAAGKRKSNPESQRRSVAQRKV
jgi:hemerythrin superfamily protein